MSLLAREPSQILVHLTKDPDKVDLEQGILAISHFDLSGTRCDSFIGRGIDQVSKPTVDLAVARSARTQRNVSELVASNHCCIALLIGHC